MDHRRARTGSYGIRDPLPLPAGLSRTASLSGWHFMGMRGCCLVPMCHCRLPVVGLLSDHPRSAQYRRARRKQILITQRPGQASRAVKRTSNIEHPMAVAAAFQVLDVRCWIGSSIELWGEERTLTLIFQASCAPG